jgi:ferric-dicitrate binding protein FerR (iron transport regulator)
MTLKIRNDKATNEAWDALYLRFERDGLLPDAGAMCKRAVLRSSGLKWAAVAAVACICIVAGIVLKNINVHGDKMLTLHNEANAPTLVATLEDGSVIYLNPQTSLKYPEHFGEDKREIAIQGDAFFEIEKNSKCPFFIDTESARIEVVGTAFNVVSKDNHFSLAVKHGEVKVTLKENGQNINVRVGESLLLQSGNWQKTTSADAGIFDAYLKRIQFKDERLADIVRVLNMNSDSVRIEVAPQLENRLLTVTLSNDSPETVSRLICLALNLQYKQTGNVISIFER